MLGRQLHPDAAREACHNNGPSRADPGVLLEGHSSHRTNWQPRPNVSSRDEVAFATVVLRRYRSAAAHDRCPDALWSGGRAERRIRIDGAVGDQTPTISSMYKCLPSQFLCEHVEPTGFTSH